MGLNFPTAFWKKQPEPSVEEFSISWETGLAWSRGGGVSQANVNSPIRHSPLTSPFPFVVEVGGVDEEYYESYNTDIWSEDPSTTPYYAWYLTGGYDSGGMDENDLSAYHQAEPWTIGATGHTLRIDFEADWDTASFRDDTIAGTRPLEAGYNQFVQSGNATGTFTVSASQAPANLVVKVSGLAEDNEAGNAPYYDVMTMYLDDGGSETLICSGEAPRDDRNILGLSHNYDMQQVKLYAGNDLETITNTNNETVGRCTIEDEVDPAYTTKTTCEANAGTWAPMGRPRGNTSQLVDQDARTVGYATTNGIGTFTQSNLSAGTYKIKVQISSIDGLFNSGSFYGMDFDLT